MIRVTANSRIGEENVDPLRGADIPAVAADPADPRHIVMVNQNFLTGDCEFRTSFDAGGSWTTGKLKGPDGFPTPVCRTLSSGGYPHMNQSLAFGTGQNVYTTFDSSRGPQQIFGAPSFGQGQADSVLVARSSDGGKTFTTATVAIEAPTGAPFPFYIRPTLGVQPRPGGDRLVAAAWGVAVTSGGPADGAGARRMVVAVSDDGGTTWSAPVDASAPGEQIREPSAAVFGPDGSIYVAWRNRDNGAAPSNVIVGKSTDGGATWSRNLAGGVTGLGQGVGGGMPQLGVDRASGTLYLVYQETQPHGDQDVFFQRSTDAGTTWSSPLRVNDDPTGNGVRQHVPRITVAPNGRLDVVWLDHRHAYPTAVIPVPRGGADVYYASSSDGGRTFSRNRRITDRTINTDMGLIPRVGSYSWFGPVAAPLGNDRVYFAWSDTRQGNVDTDTNDIVTATLLLGAGDERPSIEELPRTAPDNLSVAASQLAYPGGTERINPALTSKLVVVNKNDVAGAWAGAVLARDNAAPLLVVDGNKLTKEAKDEIGRLHPTGVYVIGDRESISDELVAAITAAGVTAAASLPVPTTAATTTTVSAPTQTSVATTTTIPTRNAFATTNVIRLEGANAAEIGRAVAGALDLRTDADRGRGAAAASAAVAVNPESEEGALALGLAAALRFPVVFVTRDEVPPPTADALRSMAIQKTYVVGGPASVGDAVMAELPAPTRLGGPGRDATSMAVANEAKARALPVNVVYVADQTRPIDSAVAAATAARNGGFLLLSPGAGTAAVERQLDELGIAAHVDRMVVMRSSTSTSVPWPVILVSVLMAVVGVALLYRASRNRRARPVPAETSTAPPSLSAQTEPPP